MIGRLKFDISELVEQILDQLPDSVWTSKTTTFLDPCMGGGQFVAAVERRLRSAGHSDKNIAQRVFGFESNQMRVNYAINKWSLVGNYQALDFLETDVTKKFDVALGNPPYQDAKKTEKGGTTLWSKFVKKTVHDVVVSGGHVAMVTPSAWMTFGKSGRPLKNKQLLTVWTDIAHYFKVGSTFSAWILENKSIYKKTQFIDENFEVDLRDHSTLPAGRPIRGLSVIEKVMSWSGPWLEPQIEKNLRGAWSERQNNFLGIDASLSPTDVYRYKVFHTNSLNYYVKDLPTDYNTPKIIVSVSSPYPRVYCDPIGCAAGDLRTYILVKDQQEGDQIMSYLNSKLYRFVWRKPGMISWKSLRLPRLENRYWTSQELYELFGLTEEEIDLVEKYAL